MTSDRVPSLIRRTREEIPQRDSSDSSLATPFTLHKDSRSVMVVLTYYDSGEVRSFPFPLEPMELKVFMTSYEANLCF